MLTLTGDPVVIDDTTVVQFARSRTGRITPFRIAVCIDHPDCPVMLFDDGDCGPHFRWATPADLDRLQAHQQDGAA